MSNNVTPIHSDILPQVDAAREMLDAVNTMLNNYIMNHGHPPHTLCVALLGNPLDCDQSSTTMTYCPTDTKTARLHACGAAALLFTKHALDD